MQGFSSIEVRINALAPACVLDAELALSPAGLLLATRMAREWPIWLMRSMWPMIDSDQLYRRCPRIISGPGEPQEDVDALIKALGDWHAAWLGNRGKRGKTCGEGALAPSQVATGLIPSAHGPSRRS